MKLSALTFVTLLAATPSLAQQQQAGNDASTNTEETFQALMEQCDDIDAIMLRNRLRVQIPRITEEAAAEAQEMMDQGLVQCGEGDLDGAKETLNAALEIAAQGATDNFGTDGTETPTETAAEEIPATVEETAAETKPWWKFW
ncbi:MAG: hypothetical protein AAGJ34_10030 [Pseudomonadota bacterium]